MAEADIAAALRRFLPEDCVLSREEERRPYECDALTVFRQLPGLVVLPRTEQQLHQVLLTCSRLGVAVVARGAGTGLSGGATPHGQGVLLSCARLNRILEIDPRARIARLEPGVPNLRVSEAAAEHGLYYAPDPSSQVACTIGGNVAENSGGVHCLKYGLTVHNVLGVRGYTMEGDLLELGGRAPDGPGLDLLALTIGSEGLLMIVTEVTVKLIPRPPCAQLVMASFADVHSAGAAVAAVIAAGIIPAALEMMDRQATAAAGRLSPDYYGMDGPIPRRHVGEVLQAIERMEARYALRCMNVFHAGDGNLHPVILFDANDHDSWERAERFGAEILELCVQLGGTITGEHGVGVEKLNSMCVQFSPAERAAFAAVKEAFDPAGLLNPGKVIPTLARCAEYGRMRVHHGALPHADLPRFLE